jgi:mycofactocin precursor
MDGQGALIVNLNQPAKNSAGRKEETMENENKEQECVKKEEKHIEVPSILEEFNIEELAVDGICGIY